MPDARYDYLTQIWNPPSKYPAYLSITDIAGLIKGASEGQGLGNAFLSHHLGGHGRDPAIPAAGVLPGLPG